MKSDPKTFWNLLNKLSSERIQDESFNQTEFIKFFQNLNVSSENIPNNEFHDNIIQKLKHSKGETFIPCFRESSFHKYQVEKFSQGF
jgi:DNA-directed RNA polymerase subunit H (RpoH/RPB5)